LSSLLNKIAEHANELSALLAAEQGGLPAQARWEIDLLTNSFGPVLLQMEPNEREQDRRRIEHVTKRYVPTAEGGRINLRNLPVILSFGKVLPALLTGDTVVLRPCSLSPLTLLRISEYIRDLVPPGVFSVVVDGQDQRTWMTSHSGIDLITFTRSAEVGIQVLGSAAGTRAPVTLELGGSDSRAVFNEDPEKIAIFGRMMLAPVNWRPRRYGLAETLFEILSFRPVRMRTQVLVWSLARKASYTFPIFR
jgi:acyl-CoA reductase-like NAD-dependent aldehyde dehydrogenase